MNRKLQHTLMALSTTAAVFTVLLLAGRPMQPSPPASGWTLAAGSPARDASTAPAADSAFTIDMPVDNTSQRRHLRHSRSLLALPYFSFAQGLRRNRS